MKKILIRLASILLFSLLFAGTCKAQVPEGGGTTTVKIDGDLQILRHDYFTLYNTGTTAVYNENGDTDINSGWVKVSNYTDSIGIEAICVIMPPTGTVTWSVQGRYGNIGTGSVLFSHTFNGVDVSSLNVPIVERPDYIRTSLVNSEDETESIIVRLKATQEKR